MDLSTYYPILIVFGVLLLILLVIIGAFFVGKRKYNKQNGIVKEKKMKERKTTEKKAKENKTKSSIRLSEKDAAAAAAFSKSNSDEFEDDDEYKEAVSTLKAESFRNAEKEVIEGPIIVVDENKVQEEVVEWKPPADDKIIVAEHEKAIAAEPAAEGWNDEDLELFEARAYSFDEENQAGYIREEKPTAGKSEIPSEPVPTFREHREQVHDPADDEGVQVFETFEREKSEQKQESKTGKEELKEDPKISNSKYAYFDSVMEKDKSSAPDKEWQPPEKRADSSSSEKPKKKGMQYIELDLEDDK